MLLRPDTLLDQYRVSRRLGSGGMADVYEAEDLDLRRRVALKVLPEWQTRHEDTVERFKREARSAASLDHRGIVQIYQVGHDSRLGLHYYSMRLLQGGDLVAHMRRGMSVSDALLIIRDLADAFAHAHSRNVIHRDVKPANVLFDDQGSPVLTDFGIAKALNSSRLTATGTTVGTPTYISPEQASGKPVDARSDLYGLGVILFEMLSGCPPFEAEQPIAVIFKHLMEPVPPLPEAFTALQPLVFSLMAKDPGARPSGAQELTRIIDELMGVTGGMSRASRRLTAPTPSFLSARTAGKRVLPVASNPTEQATLLSRPDPISPGTAGLVTAPKQPKGEDAAERAREAKAEELGKAEEARQRAEAEKKLAREAEAKRIKAAEEVKRAEDAAERAREAKAQELRRAEEARQRAEAEKLAREAEAKRIKAAEELKRAEDAAERAREAKAQELRKAEEARRRAEAEKLAREAEAKRIKAAEELKRAEDAAERAREAKAQELRRAEEARQRAEAEKLAREAEAKRIKAAEEVKRAEDAAEWAREAKDQELRDEARQRPDSLVVQLRPMVLDDARLAPALATRKERSAVVWLVGCSFAALAFVTVFATYFASNQEPAKSDRVMFSPAASDASPQISLPLPLPLPLSNSETGNGDVIPAAHKPVEDKLPQDEITIRPPPKSVRPKSTVPTKPQKPPSLTADIGKSNEPEVAIPSTPAQASEPELSPRQEPPAQDEVARLAAERKIAQELQEKQLLEKQQLERQQLIEDRRNANTGAM